MSVNPAVIEQFIIEREARSALTTYIPKLAEFVETLVKEVDFWREASAEESHMNMLLLERHPDIHQELQEVIEKEAKERE